MEQTHNPELTQMVAIGKQISKNLDGNIFAQMIVMSVNNQQEELNFLSKNHATERKLLEEMQGDVISP